MTRALRRTRKIGVLAAVLTTATLAVASAPIADPHAGAYGGETCVRCHDGAAGPTPLEPSEAFDAVIVGGGQAGLSALHYLSDRKVVLLELEKEPGGQMREAEWRGIHYAQGAAYFVEPYGILMDYYRSEKIPMVKIPPPENSAWIDGTYHGDCWMKEGREAMPLKGKAREGYLKFLEHEQMVNDTNMSNQPIENFDDAEQQLDAMNSYDWMASYGVSPDMIHLFDLYIPSCFGQGAKEVSASGFSNYISGELGGNYTLPGGMGAVTKITAGNHKDQIRLGCRVTRVEQSLKGCQVTYVGPEGRTHTIASKTVVMALPCNLLPGLIPDLPESKKQAIASTRYASYVVGAVLCNEVVWDDKGYDTWIKDAFFKDIIDADWISRGGKPHASKQQPHVLSLYIPMGVGGWHQETEWTPAEWKKKCLDDLDRVIPGSRSKIADIKFYRWAHSMHVCEPGFLKNKVPVLRQPYYRIYFAGAEVEGLPCNESAIISGYKAATQCRAWLWDSMPLASPALPDAMRHRLDALGSGGTGGGR